MVRNPCWKTKEVIHRSNAALQFFADAFLLSHLHVAFAKHGGATRCASFAAYIPLVYFIVLSSPSLAHITTRESRRSAFQSRRTGQLAPRSRS
jgi:hypothetical protein